MINRKEILLIDSYFGGSHQQWAEGLKKFSKHRVDFETMPARHWLWRMNGGAITLANQANLKNKEYDLILSSDMVDLALFKSLYKFHTPCAVYFHENQMAYPNSNDINQHFINYTTALTSDLNIFNSKYNFDSFFEGLNKLFKVFPDFKNKETIEQIKNKSKVLGLGFDFSKLEENKLMRDNKIAHILWNHRWDFDKNPEEFLNTLVSIKKKNINFKLILLGKRSDKNTEKLKQQLDFLKDNIVINEEVSSYDEYAKWLWKADIIPVTSIHDFFGISIFEAIYCDTYPILPNRLVYPEHLSQSHYENILYENNFEELLIQRIQNFQEKAPRLLLEYVKTYDWNLLINRYDELLNSVTHSS